MALTLLIENYQVLDDGGPASINVPESGLQAGRRAGMGWVLPDASRHISGHHFDIYHQGGEWWLRDVSTNGTFLHGLRHRLDGPHRLEHGDRFQVGQYIIVAMMDQPMMVGGMNPASLPAYDGPVLPQEQDDDPWSVNAGAALPPVDPLPMRPAQQQPDFAQDFMAFPRHDPQPPAAAVPQFMAPPVASPSVETPSVATPPAAMIAHEASISPFGGPAPVIAQPVGSQKEVGERPGTEATPQPQATQATHAPVPQASPGPAAPGQGDAFLRAFCEGAGVSPDLATGIAPEDLARALGQAMRTATSEIMLALRDRASAKQFVRVGERTMRGASDNNPLKFLPDPEQAIEAMFLRPRAGFQTGTAGFDDALGDLRQHQAALFAALQPALMQLLGDLAPERIEADSEGGRFGSNRKARSWDIFVQRWDARTAPHDNGILDEFINHFASAYRDALSNSALKRG